MINNNTPTKETYLDFVRLGIRNTALDFVKKEIPKWYRDIHLYILFQKNVAKGMTLDDVEDVVDYISETAKTYRLQLKWEEYYVKNNKDAKRNIKAFFRFTKEYGLYEKLKEKYFKNHIIIPILYIIASKCFYAESITKGVVTEECKKWRKIIKKL